MEFIKSFDAFPKAFDEFRVKTNSGALGIYFNHYLSIIYIVN